jgi:hypothetical protein
LCHQRSNNKTGIRLRARRKEDKKNIKLKLSA